MDGEETSERETEHRNRDPWPIGYDGTTGLYTVDCLGNTDEVIQVYTGTEIDNSLDVGSSCTNSEGIVAWYAFRDFNPIEGGNSECIGAQDSTDDSGVYRMTQLYAVACNASTGEYELYLIDSGYSGWFPMQVSPTLGQSDIVSNTGTDVGFYSSIHVDLVSSASNATFTVITYGDDGYIDSYYNILLENPWSVSNRGVQNTNDHESGQGIELEHQKLCLKGVYPNPSTDTFQISLQLSEPADISLAVYDISGRCVGVLSNGLLSAGDYNFNWDATGLPSGCYLVRLVGSGHFETARSILIR